MFGLTPQRSIPTPPHGEGGGCEFVGQRDALGACGLWESLLTSYVEVICHIDGFKLYHGVVFGALNRIGGTHYIERFNATFRLSLAHLVRRSLFFSRKQANLETLF